MRTAGAANIKKLALVIVFSALGVAISPFTWFVVFGTKANPTQHMINAILGVLVGPFWAAIAAIFIGTIRNMLGMGTVYAFPGGVPGAVVVGTAYLALQKLRTSEKTRLTSALTEPIGTLLIGVPLALFLVAPWIGTENILDLTANQGAFLAFIIFGAGWALSCVPGSIIGFIILAILRRVGISRETLFGQM
ncbi:MAG: energy coupling factor transporter S component ThiW [Candidatus Bathycorpusculaceae bacterium]